MTSAGPQLDLFDGTLCLGDPYPLYRRLRDEAPAYYCETHDFWALSRHADVLAALRDTAHLSIEGPTRNLVWETPGLSIATLDDPRHARTRELIRRGFTPRRIGELEPWVRGLLARYLDRFADAGRCDLIGELASIFPGDVMLSLVGVPEVDWPQVTRWVHALADEEVEPSQEEAFRLLFEYFGALRAERRGHPGDDLISALLVAEIDGQRLSDAELDEFFVLMGQAGQETMQAFLGLAFYWLERHPDQRRILVERPPAIPSGVEELLRYDAPTQWLARTVTGPIALHGCKLSLGQKVVMLFGSANRDERRFANPDRLDVLRDPQGMLAFGHGVHFCLGAPLARLLGQITLEEFLQRFPTYEIDHERVRWLRSAGSVMRGLRELPIAL